jgi:hypothetical protein
LVWGAKTWMFRVRTFGPGTTRIENLLIPHFFSSQPWVSRSAKAARMGGLRSFAL